MTQLMIKSHTGALVPAIVGMDVRHDSRKIPLTIGRISDNRITFCCGTWTERADTITMIFCPLQVGDEIEVMTEDGDWHRRQLTEYDLKMISPVTLKYYRHADPNLRQAPDYQPTRSDA